jgi:long-chain acyl-CoA synthetase
MTSQMNLGLMTGANIILLADPGPFMTAITKEKPTLMAGVPKIFKAMVDNKDKPEFNFSSLKICISGGAPLPAPVAEGFKKLMGFDIVEGYGLSETSPLPIPFTAPRKSIQLASPCLRRRLNFPTSPSPIKACLSK